MNRIVLACLLAVVAVASLPSDASQREGVRVRVGADNNAIVSNDRNKCTSHRQCDDGLFCNGIERCQPTDARADRNGCVAGGLPCREGEDCLEAEDRCRLGPCDVPDADGDGYAASACGGNDCDDSDPNRSPGHTEICDARGDDEDCDPSTVGDTDLDGDGYIDARCL